MVFFDEIEERIKLLSNNIEVIREIIEWEHQRDINDLIKDIKIDIKNGGKEETENGREHKRTRPKKVEE